MQKEILIIKNIAREGPGLLLDVIKGRDISYSIVDVTDIKSLKTLKNYGAVVVLGGPVSANDENVIIKQELGFISEALKMNIPYLGICLGLQLMVKAAGGRIEKCSTSEVGFRDPDGNQFTVELTDEGLQDPLFKNIGSSFKVFQLHGETVTPVNGMQVLATGKYCQNQIVKASHFAYGIQCHFELTLKMLEEWVNKDYDLIKFDKSGLLSDFNIIRDEYTKIGHQLFHNFLTIAGYKI